MAIVRAIKTGNWSDPTVWNTGALPTPADDVYSNGFLVTLDVSATVLSVQNAATTGVTMGGRFIATNGVTLTATGAGFLFGHSNGTALIDSSLTAGQQITLVGSFGFNLQTNNAPVVLNRADGTINSTGNIQGGTGSNAHGIQNNAAGVINHVGNVTAGISSGVGIQNAGTGTVLVTGNLVAGQASPAVANLITGTCSIIGSITSSNGASGFVSLSFTAVNVLTGPFITSANGCNPVLAQNWKWATQAPVSSYQVRSAVTNAVRSLFTSEAVGGNPSPADVRSGTVYGVNNEQVGTCSVPGPSSVVVGVPVDATVGTAAVTAATIRAALGMASANLDAQLADKPNVSAITSAVWAAVDKTGYGLSEAERMAIATAVQAGILNESDGQQILNAIVNAIGNQNIDQVALVAAIRADLERNGGTLATRLAASAYTAPLDAAGTRSAVGLAAANLDSQLDALPTAAENATAVRTELGTELGRIDAAVSSRLAPDSTLARVTLTDTATTLTNAPDVPTTAEIAAEVRAELTPELERVANCATVETTGDQIAALQ